MFLWIFVTHWNHVSNKGNEQQSSASKKEEKNQNLYLRSSQNTFFKIDQIDGNACEKDKKREKTNRTKKN